MRSRFVVRRSAFHHRAEFEASVVATVAAAGILCETDLMQAMRGGLYAAFAAPTADGKHWSFGAYDFRAIVGGLVSDGRLVEVRGRQRAGGVQTTYNVGKELADAS